MKKRDAAPFPVWGTGKRDDGLPGAAKNTGDESRLLLFTLPWRGRVDRRNEVKADGVG